MNNVYFSPGETCKKAIISHIDGAQDALKICVFTISDDDIAHAIIQAYRRGLEVTIITDNDKTEDRGSDVYRLFKEGIEVKTDETPNHMHHKFAIIDDEILLTGSFNWTRSATKYNQENILITDNADIVSPYLQEYDRLWDTMVNYY